MLRLALLLAIPPLAWAAEDAFLPLRLGEIQPEGWLRAQLARDVATGYLGHLDALLRDPKSKRLILAPENNDYVSRFNNRNVKLDAKGLAVPEPPQRWWDGEMIGDWHDGLIRTAFLTGDKRSRERADRFVAAILKSQDDDGYIGIYPKGFRFRFSGPDGELWTQRCVMLPLLAYHEFTGRADVLRAVERAVQLTIRQFDGHNYFDNAGQIGGGVSHGLMFVDVLEWLHRITGRQEYGLAAVRFYDDYSAAKNVKNADAQMPKLLDPKAPLGGHGPDIMGFLRIPLYSYYVTGKPSYRQAWENSMVKTVRGLGVGGSPLSGQGEEIKTAGQTPDMPYEFCSTFYLLHSLTWAVRKTGEPRHGDLLERTLFNAAQGARSPDGKTLTYYSADERLWVRQKPPEGTPNFRYIYSAATYPSCCHNSGARAYPYAVAAMWMRSRGADGDGLAAAVYGPSRVETKVKGVTVAVDEKTRYPFGYEIEFVVRPERAVEFPLRLRVPAWSGEPAVEAKGASVKRDARGFLTLTKMWKAGDKVVLKLKPSVQGMPAAAGKTAVTYGPLVFSLPVAEKAEITQRFPEAEAAGVAGFFGYQYDAADLAAARRPLKLAAKPGFGFSAAEERGADASYPWDRAALRLRGGLLGAGGKPEKVELLPMGATLLRRTCFEK
ncbi:MAG: glycoside hydrolase family 127 protein [Bryobacterales bacterium]|nr:glycoside hydrolase family 127 protein [Bryobacterales bacterium]